MASWNAAAAAANNVVMMRKDDHGSNNDTGLVAMLSSAGLRGLDHSPPLAPPPKSSSSKRPLYAMLDSLDESGDGEIADDGSTGGAGGYAEKKRRLSVEQVRSLEMSFEMENRLEPVRKMQLAQELGLQPRQVAVWFQNRRARWKTKQLERDYDVLKSAYESLADENKKLRAQLQKLTKADNDDDNSLLKNDEEELEEAEESGGAGADKLNNPINNKSSGVEEDEETCDSPTVVSSKFKDSPSSDGYGSEVMDAFSPHATAPVVAATLPAAAAAESSQMIDEASQSVKEEPMTFPYKLDDGDALRGLEDDASYSCLFGAAADEEQGNWAWWDWSS